MPQLDMGVSSPNLSNYAFGRTVNQSLYGYPDAQSSQKVYIMCLKFADDVVVVGNSSSKLRPALDRLDCFESSLS